MKRLRRAKKSRSAIGHKAMPDTRILEAMCSVLLMELVYRHGSDLQEMYEAVRDVARVSGCRDANSDIAAVFKRINDGVKYQYEKHWGVPAPDAVNRTNWTEITAAELRSLSP